MGMLSTAKMYFKRPDKLDAPTDLYEHTIGLLDGGTLDLETLRGNPTLIVNTASKCGFTPQFEGLQKLYEHYHERGLQILGTPSGDFNEQELDTATEIGEFCQTNYGVTFPMTEKVSVRQNPHPLWEDLARQPDSGPPVWNFTKYLVGADGRLLTRWATKVKPEDPAITAAIEAALSQV